MRNSAVETESKSGPPSWPGENHDSREVTGKEAEQVVKDGLLSPRSRGSPGLTSTWSAAEVMGGSLCVLQGLIKNKEARNCQMK